MSRTLSFVQVDVFTDRQFGGNPLAVFFAAAGLPDATLQALAREMNLSETAFLLPPRRPEYAARLRIFTPNTEFTFAGHPTIGTGWVLAAHGLLPAGAQAAVLEEGIGPVPIQLTGDPRQPSFVWFSDPVKLNDSSYPDRAAFAAAVGLSPDDLLPDLPIVTGSAGNPKLYLPLRDPATVDRAVLDPPQFLRACGGRPVCGLYLVAPHQQAGQLYGRMLGFGRAGVYEDPATGSAVGPLAVHLWRHGLLPHDLPQTVICQQGTQMGRQSFLHVRLTPGPTGDPAVAIGGAVVPVLAGTVTLADTDA
jgi:trans-2,3-dihydro-3-hydroxyanthranilate isomerase